MAELKDNTEKFQRLHKQRMVNALNRANQFVVDEARGAAPVKTGELHDNTEVIQEASETSLIAAGASKMPYAAAVNRHNEPFWMQAWLRMKVQFGGFFRG